MVSASNIPKYLLVSFSPSILIFSWFGSFVPSVIIIIIEFFTSVLVDGFSLEFE